MADRDFLERSRCLNQFPEKVRDCKFLEEGSFFDPRDIAQVRYELLRRCQVEHMQVAEACRSFGFSRTTYYKIDDAFARGGIAGLVGRPRGRPEPIKVTDDVLGYLLSEKAIHPDMPARQAAEQVKKRYGKSVSVRMIQHVWQQYQAPKKTQHGGD